MLVITRLAGEKIRIGDDIVVTLLPARGGRYRVGIDAPDSVRILRGELQPNTEANQGGAPSVSKR